MNRLPINSRTWVPSGAKPSPWRLIRAKPSLVRNVTSSTAGPDRLAITSNSKARGWPAGVLRSDTNGQDHAEPKKMMAKQKEPP